MASDILIEASGFVTQYSITAAILIFNTEHPEVSISIDTLTMILLYWLHQKQAATHHKTKGVKHGDQD